MSEPHKPIPLSREPSGYLTNGRDTIGFLFDTSTGTVATLPDRIPLGTFPNWKEARRAIHEARDALSDALATRMISQPATIAGKARRRTDAHTDAEARS